MLKKKDLLSLIIKPINGGSSNGLMKVNNKNELNSFLKTYENQLKNYIFEEFINGREITVGILNNKVCGIMEIIFDSELYDYKNKYVQIS